MTDDETLRRIGELWEASTNIASSASGITVHTWDSFSDVEKLDLLTFAQSAAPLFTDAINDALDLIHGVPIERTAQAARDLRADHLEDHDTHVNLRFVKMPDAIAAAKREGRLDGLREAYKVATAAYRENVERDNDEPSWHGAADVGVALQRIIVDAEHSAHTTEPVPDVEAREGDASFHRGHVIVCDERWSYADTGQLVRENIDRECGKCGKPNTADGHDGCLGTIPGVRNACCGHGYTPSAYVQFLDGRELREQDAVDFFARRVTGGE